VHPPGASSTACTPRTHVVPIRFVNVMTDSFFISGRSSRGSRRGMTQNSTMRNTYRLCEAQLLDVSQANLELPTNSYSNYNNCTLRSTCIRQVPTRQLAPLEYRWYQSGSYR